MYDKKYWREQFPLQIAGYGNFASAKVTLYTGEIHLVRKVMKTEDGYGIFEMYLDATGNPPIIESTSNTFDFDTSTPFNSLSVSLPYENIASVTVKLASDAAAIVH